MLYEKFKKNNNNKIFPTYTLLIKKCLLESFPDCMVDILREEVMWCKAFLPSIIHYCQQNKLIWELEKAIDVVFVCI